MEEERDGKGREERGGGWDGSEGCEAPLTCCPSVGASAIATAVHVSPTACW